MTAPYGRKERLKYPTLKKSNRPGTNISRSTALRATTNPSLNISHHYKPKRLFFCDSKEGCRYELIEAFFLFELIEAALLAARSRVQYQDFHGYIRRRFDGNAKPQLV